MNSADRVRKCVLDIYVAMHGQWSLINKSLRRTILEVAPFLGSACGSVTQ